VAGHVISNSVQALPREPSSDQAIENEKKVFSFGTVPHRSQEYYLTRTSSLTGPMRFKAPNFIAAPKQPVKPAPKQPPAPVKKSTPFGMNLKYVNNLIAAC
jgi:hypothetical protein